MRSKITLKTSSNTFNGFGLFYIPFLPAWCRSRNDFQCGRLPRSVLQLQAGYHCHNQSLRILHTGNDRSSPLYPEFLPASAKIRHLSCLDRLIERFLIHICQHQDLLCLIMLDDDRDQALIIGLKTVRTPSYSQKMSS